MHGDLNLTVIPGEIFSVNLRFESLDEFDYILV